MIGDERGIRINLTNVHVEVVNRVGRIVIDRPPVNALNRPTILELHQIFDSTQANVEIKAVLVTGKGKCFVAGADLKELTEVFDDQAKAEEISREGQRLLDKIERSRKPVIAAINGACLGGGLELAMSCHMRIAAEEAIFGLPEIKVGIIPGYGGTQRLAKLTNRAKALELILTGEAIDGMEAARIGLVNQVCPANEVLARAVALAEAIALERSSVSVERALDAVLAGTKMTSEEGQALEAQYFGELFMTGDAKEGITAFLEKRKPDFHDL
ncbi:enoyl-CoA hydratase [Paenibacillus hemerocallicola]|uniref:Enoyl-CoA hydratase n=1 Tax=Paenibacillus hemerocallicola TaxID=1172614 RepID=A0A5C4TBX0_9BACL|nr:enoyl-CoA hydratase-related protein [Paenibacillus hemerocallicola]TNJ65977.1 enoyl-CoA hydratase [Paenibacillus hemerocallicola]